MSDTLLVSTLQGLFEVRRTSSRWLIDRTSFMGMAVSPVLTDYRDGTWYVAVHGSDVAARVFRSEDEGDSWSLVGAPGYPALAEGAGGPLKNPSSVKRIWILAPGGADRLGELWAGTVPGGLFRSKDRGETWTRVEALWRHPERKRWFAGIAGDPGIHSILVDPRDSSRLLIGVSCGGIWETVDDGETWNVCSFGMRATYVPPNLADDPVLQDVHLVAACHARFDTLWVQHQCGIWLSHDGARSWSEIGNAGPSAFGFTVVAHPHDCDTAFFVPSMSDQQRVPCDGQFVVTRTRDGGRSFDILREGLPQQNAYDVVGRHAFDIDAAGECLALGSTTGNLWITEDSGDSFSMMSKNLPPIHGVRFAHQRATRV